MHPRGAARRGLGVQVADTLSAGDKVEVRRKFDAQWAKGFEVVEPTERGFRIRRLSDGEVLPVEFAERDLRKESRRNDFWWM
jgi:hypothetical protein